MNIVSALVGLISGVAAGMGLGGGTVLLIYLALFTDTPQATSGGINLVVFIPTALCAVIIYAIRKQIDFKRVLPMAAFGILGSLACLLFVDKLPTDVLSKIFGGLLCVMALSRLIPRKS